MSWSSLLRADAPLFSKICVSILTIIQRFFGILQMWTCVNLDLAENQVHHSTKIRKWGATIYKSEKTFLLEKDGSGITFEGTEHYWPLFFIGVPFARSSGTVDGSTTRASYQMPLAGSRCDCRAVLELPEGYIEIVSPWIKGRFSLTERSNNILKVRFEESE